MGLVVDLEKHRAEDKNIRRHALAFVAERLAAAHAAKLEPADILNAMRDMEQTKLDLMLEMGNDQRPFDALARATIAEVDRQLAQLAQSSD